MILPDDTPDDVMALIRALESRCNVLLTELKSAQSVYAYRAALCEKLHGNAELKRKERYELAGEARAYGYVANEIAALITKTEGANHAQ
jgi:hypothetical protein